MTSHIRIPDIAPVVQDTADGVRTTFDFPFPIFVAADLEVLVGDAPASGLTIRGAGSSEGGAVKFAVAPAAGSRVTIRRRQTYARTEDFLDERAPTPHELNDSVDQTVAALQELAEENSRAVHRAASADLSRPVNLTLPEPEAGKVIGWNGSADAMVNLPQVDSSDMLRKSQNLADLPDKAQARINLGLGSAATHDVTEFATAAQGAKADTALQPSSVGTAVQAHDADLDWLAANLTEAGRALIDDADADAQRATLGLAAVAASGSYDDLSNRPALGTAASHAATDFATAAQGAKADTAVQPSALGSAAYLNVGTAAGQVVQLDASGKLPAVDGSQLTNLPSSGGTPTGAVIAFAGATAPSGWLICNGSAVSRTTYAALFAALGTTFGAGDGSTTFALPDLRGRTAIGAGQGTSLSNRTLGAALGEENHTLTVAEMPSHNHGTSATGSISVAVGNIAAQNEFGVQFGSAASGSGASSATGGNGAHNSMQPSLVLNYIIKI